jgi:hypothetical protein
MKNIKVYNLKKTIKHRFQFKVAIFTTFFLLLASIFSLFNNTNYLFTDILQNRKISLTELKQKINNLEFDGTIWPLKQVVDLNYKHISSL